MAAGIGLPLDSAISEIFEKFEPRDVWAKCGLVPDDNPEDISRK